MKIKNSALAEVMMEAASMQGGILALIQRAYVAGFDEGVQHACNTFERVLHADEEPAIVATEDAVPFVPGVAGSYNDCLVPTAGVLDGNTFMVEPHHD